MGRGKDSRRPLVAAFLTGLSVFLLVSALRLSGQAEFLELAAYDWLVRLSAGAEGQEKRVTLIEISEEDINSLGSWPVPDGTIARGLEILARGGPRAIGLDIYRDIPVPPGTQELERAFSGNPHLVGVMKFGMEGAGRSAIRDPEQIGFNDIIVDQGGIVRRALLFLDDGESVQTSFALRLASLYLGHEGISPEADPANGEHLRLGGTTIRPFEPDDGGYIGADAKGYQFLLDFRDSGGFQVFSFSDLLAGKVPEGAVRDRAVIVCVGAQSVKDFFYTPLSRGFDADQQTTGGALHAHIASQLIGFALDGAGPVWSLPEWQEAVWVLVWGLSGGFVGLWVRSARRFSIASGAGLTLLFLVVYNAFQQRLWLPLVPPAAAFLVSSIVVTAYVSSREKAERALLMQLFSRHVSREIADLIWQQKDEILRNGRPGAQKMVNTVFFSDLRGFTAMSERMDPKELFDWLNDYMETMARVIMEHGGVVDDYFGDGIKANFGVPFPRNTEDEVAKDAVNAVTCALAMGREMERLNGVWCARGLPAMGVRIGIHTGPVVAGLLGSSQRYKYTTIGDTVNAASRIEGYEKEIGRETACRILVGESTMRRLGSRFEAERIGEASLKGKDERIVIYRVLGRASQEGGATSLQEISR